jgi:hypothetical protein
MKKLLKFEERLNESKLNENRFIYESSNKMITVSLTTTAAASVKKDLKANNIKYTEVRPTVIEIEDSPKGKMAIQQAKERFGMQSVLVKKV